MSKILLVVAMFGHYVLAGQENNLPLSFYSVSDTAFSTEILRAKEIKKIEVRITELNLDSPYNSERVGSMSFYINKKYQLDSSFLSFYKPNQKNLSCKFRYENDLVSRHCVESNLDIEDTNNESPIYTAIFTKFRNNIPVVYKEHLFFRDSTKNRTLITDSIVFSNDSVEKRIIYFQHRNNTIDSTIALIKRDSLNRIISKNITPFFYFEPSINDYMPAHYELLYNYSYLGNRKYVKQYNIYYKNGAPFDTITVSSEGIIRDSLSKSIVLEQSFSMKEKNQNAHKRDASSDHIFYSSYNGELIEIQFGEIKKTIFYQDTKLPTKVVVIHDRVVSIYDFNYN